MPGGDVISRSTYIDDPVGNRLVLDGDVISRSTYIDDPVGNRLVLDADGELTTSTYDAANRLQAAEDLSGITTYSWTYENQLAQLEEPDDVITTNVYAPTNRKGDELRITKETDVGIVNFIYDDQNLIQEVDDTGTIEAEYTLNPQPYGNLISQRRESESTFYNYDALGSAQSLTDQTGTVENDYTYTAFGKILSQSGSTDNSFTWVGELGYYQEANGDYLLRQRWYGEQVNRFFSQDPIGFDKNAKGVRRADPPGDQETGPQSEAIACQRERGSGPSWTLSYSADGVATTWTG